MRKKEEKVTFICVMCKNEYIVGIRCYHPEELLCRKCRLSKTKIERYGSIDEYNTKMNKTREETCINKYGSSSLFNSDYFKNKSKETFISKYGVENCQQIKEVKEKTKKKKIELYGSAHSNPKKAKETCMQRYGFESFAQTPNFSRIIKSRYSYKNNYFDSSWELAYYIYLEDNNISFIYKPDGLSYKDQIGKIHIYHPDFYAFNRYIEIKGNHLINEKGEIYCCYKNKDQEAKNLLSKYKQECMIKNNVEILSKNEITPILLYISKKYGINYLSSFKVTKQSLTEK